MRENYFAWAFLCVAYIFGGLLYFKQIYYSFKVCIWRNVYRVLNAYMMHVYVSSWYSSHMYDLYSNYYILFLFFFIALKSDNWFMKMSKKKNKKKIVRYLFIFIIMMAISHLDDTQIKIVLFFFSFFYL